MSDRLISDGDLAYQWHESDPYKVERIPVRQVRSRRCFIPVRHDRAMRRTISAQAKLSLAAWAAPWTFSQALLHRLQPRKRNAKK